MLVASRWRTCVRIPALDISLTGESQIRLLTLCENIFTLANRMEGSKHFPENKMSASGKARHAHRPRNPSPAIQSAKWACKSIVFECRREFKRGNLCAFKRRNFTANNFPRFPARYFGVGAAVGPRPRAGG